MTATIRVIVDEALRLIGQVSGVGVQEFSEDRMREDAIRGFNFIFKKHYWEQYREWNTIVLDGTLGIPSTDAFEQTLDFEDFVSVHRAGERTRLPILPKGLNPNTITGNRVLYWTALSATSTYYAKRKLQFWPKAAIGSVDVLSRVYPLVPPAIQFDWEDSFYLDKDLLVYATAYMTMAIDDLNSTGTNTCQAMMEMRFKDIMAALGEHPIPLTSGGDIPRDWFSQP